MGYHIYFRFFLSFSFIIHVVLGQPAGEVLEFGDLFDGNFNVPGGLVNGPGSNFDDPNLPPQFLTFVQTLPSNLIDVVPLRCRAPIDSGTCRGGTIRWGYDAAVRECRPFIFSNCNGNQNNFRTRALCQTLCSKLCQQSIEGGNCNAVIPRWGFDTFTGRCQTFSFTGCGGNSNSFGSERACIESCGDVCLLPILRGPGQSTIARWGYNFLAGRCQEFLYGGSLGNRNNFLTRVECEQTCLPNAFPECPVIDITLIQVGPFGVGCVDSAVQVPCPVGGCQDGFACCENGCGSVCVQLPIDVVVPTCSQPIATGSCGDEIPRFAFNENLGTCELFLYTGCNGNDNNFANFAECLLACVPDVCTLELEHGPCSQNMLRWGYDTATQSCVGFEYGGCLGNGNNFATPGECESVCFRGLEIGNICEQAIDPGVCPDSIVRYAYNTETGFCVSFNYGGCGGNQNNFATLLECDGICPPGITESVCELPIDPGPCDATIQRWAFNSALQQCVTFSYGGCDGNSNIFLDQASCETRCLDQGVTCPDGSPPCANDPCTAATCPASPNAICTVDLCSPNRDCIPVFVDAVGNTVNCQLVAVLATCEMPILRGPCALEVFSWGYNAITNQCEGFIYGGCLFNENNFASYALCAQECLIGLSNVDVCAQPVQAGFCTEEIQRWAYDPSTDTCFSFIYSGCAGNGNSFATYRDCLNRCIVNPTFTCNQPIVPGPCTEFTTRYAYDTITNQCRQFTFGGCQGNNNNFETIGDCSLTCRALIPVCNQPILAGPCTGSFPAWAFDANTGQCQFFLQSFCPIFQNSFETFETCAQECSAPLERCNIPILTGSCNDAITRWGFNTATRQCQTFIYTGCDGNPNSFASQTECEQNCDVIEPAVNPCELSIDAGPCDGNDARFGYNPAAETCVGFSFGGCGGNANNFVLLADCLQRCTVDVCAQPITNCPGDETRWVYDLNTGNCISISYGGCQPSGNFFLTEADCIGRCETPTCNQDRVPGSCSAQLTKFAFNSVSGLCEVFTYSGCGGTANLFDTLTECQSYCQVATCLRTSDPGPCSLSVPSFTFNSVTGSCEGLNYGGCLGSQNRFTTLAECQTTCDVIEPVVNPCELSIDAGPCNINEIRFGYNPALETCVIFTFGGCGGNANNFISLTECVQRCIVDVCAQPITNCPGAETRWVFDLNTANCISISYGGCQPSGNYFLTEADCIGRCETPTCNQDRVPGSCSAQLTKFAFNSVSGLCEVFTYSGCGGTANLFDTLTECQSYCQVTTCLRTSDPGPCFLSVPSFTFNSVTGSCEGFNYGGCLGSQNRFTTLAECQTTCEVIEPVVNPCELSIDAGPCNINEARFGYNPALETCVSFTFGGCGGNANNFISLSECLQRCTVDVCAQPITNCPGAETRWVFDLNTANCISISYGGCQPSGNYFLTEEDCIGRCETPTCNQDRVPGSCSAQLTKFAFNSVSGLCEVFTYSGCGGTANLFDTLTQCQSHCQVATCLRTSDPGPCFLSVPSFTFNSVTGSCEGFNYGGCLGSQNRFTTLAECQTTCEVIEPVVNPCELSIDAGPCNINEARFGYNPALETCVSFTFGGCGGNANNFISLSECLQRCTVDACAQPITNCPGAETRWVFDLNAGNCIPISYGGCQPSGNYFLTEADCIGRCETPTCNQDRVPGSCSAQLTKFAFNSVSGLCEVFTYSGCGGTANLFDTLTQCQSYCQVATCLRTSDPGPCPLSVPSFTYNSVTGSCEGLNYGGCLGSQNRFTTLTECQATCEVVNPCELSIDAGPCNGNEARFGYNPSLETCVGFTFGGCGGNANNFVSLADCLQRCTVDACAQPITNCPGADTRWVYDLNTNNCVPVSYGGCQPSGNYFPTEADCISRCETPTCNQDRVPGSCSAQLTKFAFNSVSGLCEVFTYSGCGGTANLFDTLTECQSHCQVSTCLQTLDPGPCSLSVPSFTYNSVTRVCEGFNYGGCLGSQNRFTTLAECQTTCEAINPCELSIDVGPCDGNEARFGYNPEAETCVGFTFGGCGGNANNFVSLVDCLQRCTFDVCAQPITNCPGAETRWVYDVNAANCIPISYGGCQPSGNFFLTEADCIGRCETPTCNQDRVPGSCSAQLTKFAFNSVSGLCESFTYSGCGGTANLFDTFTECQSHCQVASCLRTLDPGPCSLSVPSFTFNSVTRVCEAFNYGGCLGSQNRFTTLAECQTTCEAINPCELSIDAGPCNGNQARFGYNPEAETCVGFTFGGCGGNANNFVSLADCLQRCTVDVCAQPITNCPGAETRWVYDLNAGNCIPISYGGCQPSGNYFLTEADCISRCETPTCNQDRVPGSCSAQLTKFAFNSVSGLCEVFTYSGCGGTANVFDTLTECQSHCQVATCLRTSDPGPCSLSISSFTYNPVTRICEGLNYGGCLGSQNRFTTLAECQTTCEAPEADVCTQVIDPGICTDNVVRFAYNAATESCQQFDFGGCGGNQNNFLTLNECNQRCVTDVCAQPIVSCPGGETRWGYDPNSQTCIEFSYGGCVITGNFFTSQALCQQRCETETCAQAITFGACSAALQRFAFNTITGQCAPFTYSGCGGSANNFNSLTECELFCESTICNRPQDSGPCSAQFSSFSYNPIDGICQEFVYGGCLGSTNRFANRMLCEDTCISDSVVDPCSLLIDSGPCSQNIARFAYNALTETCIGFGFGGCNGNANNFETMAACEERCVTDVCAQPRVNCPGVNSRWGYDPSMQACVEFSYDACTPNGNFFLTQQACQDRCEALICSQDMSFGTCSSAVLRFGYNTVTGTCESYTYSGCGGTANRFETLALCQQFCETNICGQPQSVGPCGASIVQFSYNADTGVCDQFTYGGCLGSTNRFNTLEICQAACIVAPVTGDPCSLAVDAGPCSFFATRFAFDPLTGICQAFTYGGCAGNSNNFATEAECTQRCITDVCAQPMPNCPGAEMRFTFDVNQGSCVEISYDNCATSGNVFQSQLECLLRCATPVCAQNVAVGICTAQLPRFYYDAQTMQCQPFTYTGCGGNANNFNTLSECQQFCEVDSCGQTLDSGPCSLSLPRFRFNSATSSCEPFSYSGCLGSDNVFTTIELCQTRCIVDVCTLPQDIGSCGFFNARWFYNDNTNQCQSFFYSGCLGNANRFNSEAECQARCQVNICSQPEDPGPCSASLQSFSYNSDLNMCQEFSFGGCLGGGNRFDLLSICQSVCVVGVGDPCSQPLDVGSCGDNVVRFAYNPLTGECQSFTFGGCGGNLNNFETADLCNQRCVLDVCAQPITICDGPLTMYGYDPVEGDCMPFSYNNCPASGNIFSTIEACRQRCTAPVCSQAVSVGTCSGELPRFAFNEFTGQCQSLTYSGCGGTANRFNTLTECEQTCEVDTCAQMQDGGPCALSQAMFTYNPFTATCEFLSYGGCLGSENVFPTFTACSNRCNVNVCSLPLDPGSCSQAVTVWGFDINTGNCRPFSYNGCLGNPNRFLSEALCQARCEVPACQQPQDEGPCLASQIRFAFDIASSTCSQFSYGGCLGGGNNFLSLAECQTDCGVVVPVGDACTQPINAGNCADNLVRFAYNPATGQCQDFTFTGCAGNNNNFLTMEACNRRCFLDVCAQPLTSCPGAETVFSFDVSIGDCRQFTYDNCQDTGNVFETLAECRARCTAPVCSQAIVVGPCSGSLTTFAFSSASGQCISFRYSGCGGTANRFNSMGDCQQNCEVDVCTQPLNVGPCFDSVTRIRFNPMTGSCESFDYSGCLGNENIFLSTADCQVRCNVNLCSLPLDQGACSEPMMVWGFNSNTNLCQEFTYSGCLGNPNRFASQADCQARCEAIICNQPEDSGPCTAFVPRFSFSSISMSCQEFNYGGCLGGGNSFLTSAACEDTCTTPITGDSCVEPMDPGPCDGVIERFAYVPAAGTCQSFTYGGCGGNTNNFASIDACFARCLSDVCSQEFSVCPGTDSRFGYDVATGTCVSYTTLDGCGATGNLFATEADCQQRCVEPTCNQTIEVGNCAGNFQRFGFDRVTAQCVSFTYTGCGGNANRFTTLLECQQNCELDICARPTASVGNCNSMQPRFSFNPRTGQCISFDYGGCHGAENNFMTMNECETRCLDTDVCAFPLDPGSCSQPTEVFGFNDATGNCEQFTYNGCDGNPNRFATMQDCQNRCIDETCTQPEDAGPCSATVQRFRFNQASASCELYNYGGCFGSANSFTNLASCQARCFANLCALPMDSGRCNRDTQPWFFNSAANECQQFTYTGCLGNPNRFDNLLTCRARCEVPTCNQPIDPGPCSLLSSRFAFDPDVGVCTMFNFGGCLGGTNRFTTIDLCRADCVEQTPSCPTDIVEPNSALCTILFCTLDSQCPSGQLCCDNGCPGGTGMACLPAIFVPTKAGACPSAPEVDPLDCMRFCELDSECPGDMKCCYNGCGSSCMDPV